MAWKRIPQGALLTQRTYPTMIGTKQWIWTKDCLIRWRTCFVIIRIKLGYQECWVNFTSHQSAFHLVERGLHQVIRSNQWLYILRPSGRGSNCDEICLKERETQSYLGSNLLLKKVISSKGKLSSRFSSCSLLILEKKYWRLIFLFLFYFMLFYLVLKRESKRLYQSDRRQLKQRQRPLIRFPTPTIRRGEGAKKMQWISLGFSLVCSHPVVNVQIYHISQQDMSLM